MGEDGGGLHATGLTPQDTTVAPMRAIADDGSEAMVPARAARARAKAADSPPVARLTSLNDERARFLGRSAVRPDLGVQECLEVLLRMEYGERVRVHGRVQFLSTRGARDGGGREG